MLDALLTHTLAVLLHNGVVTLRRVAQDGTRVRASAGAASFRRRATLEECLAEAQRQVTETAQQQDGGVSAVQAARRQRAAARRAARIQAALAELPQVEAIKAKYAPKKGEPTTEEEQKKRAARVSTTDPEARVMKMADGGFRPAYNVELATDVDGRAIVGVAVTNVGSDQGQFAPMVEQIEERTGQVPAAYLVDGGFVTGEAVDLAAEKDIVLYAPPAEPKNGRDPAAPCKGDSPAQKEWRQRMATPEAKQVYKDRAATAEWINADARTHRNLTAFTVRGLGKVTCCVLWFALAHNLLRAGRAGVSLLTS
jgi:hypothetical protein